MKVHPFVGCTVSIVLDRWFRHTSGVEDFDVNDFIHDEGKPCC